MKVERFPYLCLTLMLVAGGCKDKPRGRTETLWQAAGAGHIERVEALLSSGVGVSATDPGGNTTLHEAVREGQMAVAELLVARGAGINLQNQGGADAVA